MSKARGIGLLSGGLDSAIACLLVREAGAEVECVHFFTGFCVTGHNSRVGRRDRPVANSALQVAAEIGVPVELIDVADDYLPVVLKPRHGYGKFMNPCLDCRTFMLARAKQYMIDVGADFVFTGEVIGQRPKSQLKKYLNAAEREVGLEGRLLRPLSARLMPPTIVEDEGLVDRECFLDIHGRGRKRQIAIAKAHGLERYMSPAGGCCFLTDKSYSRKLLDAIVHDGTEDMTPEDVFVLGVGRHFRLNRKAKLIVGRDEVENNFLKYYERDHWFASALGFAGPTAIVVGEPGENEFGTIGALVARYCDGRGESEVSVRLKKGPREIVITVPPAQDSLLAELRV